MKNTNKIFRMLSVVLVVIMVFTTMPTVFALDNSAVVENVDTGVTYDNLYAAFDAANNDDTIKLLDDIDDSASTSTNISSKVVLDLNGKKLKASQFLAFGDVIDTSKDSVGGVVISNDMTVAYAMFQPENSYIPLYDSANGCYRFFTYEAKVLGYQENLSADSVKFGFVIRMNSKVAYELIAADTSVFKMQMNLSVENNSGTPDQKYKYTCDSSLIKKYAQTIVKNYDVFAAGKNVTLTFSVAGIARMAKGTVITASPVMSSPSTRVCKEGNSKVYNKTTDQVVDE